MALQKITDAVAELFTLAEAKAHLRETGSSSDTYITRAIVAARLAAEEALHRSLTTTVWRLTLDEFPCAIKLERPPIVSVQSVKYVDSTGVLQTLDPALYQVALTKEPGRIVPAYGQTWPSTRPQLEAVEVNYTAGYGAGADDVPETIRQWALLALADMYQTRGRSSADPIVPQAFVDQLLDGYSIWSV